ncbi:MAG TPA: aminodeoxychorismate synthase component I [Rhizomicrobium sp.]|nr:aminodeoxychorismate synthase component I [Rhizomicrobium sp.]
MAPPLILLDTAQNDRLLGFHGFRGIVAANDRAAIEPALAALEAARAEGAFAVGYFSYELGYALEPRLASRLPGVPNVPLLWFALFDKREEIEPAALAPKGRAWLGPLSHGWSRADYAARFERTHRYIADGDIYQANLSFRSQAPFVGDPLALWLTLRAKAAVRHGAFIDNGDLQILSLSPELFFEISATGQLRARPMKGTAPRGAEPSSDAAARAHLAMSAKDRAENLMIVDLLRNDLGRIAQTGSVAVENLFTVETYPTLHTMVSTVTAQLKPATPIRDVLHALFPCGSVTGAPKIRAMEILHDLEDTQRGVYCGAIGHFAPDGSASFNVAIRTLTVKGNACELGIGGGVVWDSRADAEYDECLLKARYTDAARKPFVLIETLRYAEGFTRLDLHLARMAHSAQTFSIPFQRADALHALHAAVAPAKGALRVRLTLDEAGAFSCTSTPMGDAPTQWSFALSPQSVQSSDQLLRHKTSWRETYEAEHARLARETGSDEVLFLNERGELAEGSRTNIFLRLKDQLYTPPQSAGLLNGCLRQELLASGDCAEKTLTLADLQGAEIYLGNSLRGLIRSYPTRRMA